MFINRFERHASPVTAPPLFSMPPLILRRCHCTVRNCGQFTDPDTHEKGVLLNTRDFRIHQQDEARHQMSKQIASLQTNLLHRHEADVADKLCNSPMPPTAESPPPARQGKYKFERNQELVALVAPCRDELTDIEAQLLCLPALSASSSNADIQNRQHLVDHFLVRIDSLRTDLSLLKARVHGFVAAARMHAETSELHSRVHTIVKEIASTCAQMQEARKRQREQAFKDQEGLYASGNDCFGFPIASAHCHFRTSLYSCTSACGAGSTTSGLFSRRV